MAYSFGGGVRPELGRTDFTPFLQGSVEGAKSRARGGEHVAAGIASAGNSIAGGVKTYFANKELVASRIGKIEGGMSDPEVMKRVMASERGKKHMETMEKTGTLPLIASAELFSLVDEAKDATATDMKRQLLESNLALNAFKMRPPGPEAPPAAMRTLEIRAEEAGLQPGTPEYRQFMLYGGAQPPQDKLTSLAQNYEYARRVLGKNHKDASEWARAGVGGTTTINTGDNREDADTAAARTKRNQDFFGKAEAGVGAMRQTIELKKLLESGDVNTGMLAPIMQGIDRFVAALGGQEAAQRASATEKAKSFMASEVFQYIQQLGLGSRNFDTPNERAFIETASTGDITMIRSAILDLAKKRYDEARRNVERHNDRAEESEGYRGWVKGFNYDVPIYDILEWDDGSGNKQSSEPVQTVLGEEWVQDENDMWNRKPKK